VTCELAELETRILSRFMFKMELSPEKDNFIKLSYILLDVVAQHLREYFVKLWDKKYPAEKWHDDVAKRNLKLQSLLAASNKKLKQDIYSQKILNGDEKEWDLTTLIRALADSGLHLIKGCRPPVLRTIPLRKSEEIEIIRGIRNAEYGHISSMSCPMAKFRGIMTKIKSVAKNLFGEDAEMEIYTIEVSPVTPAMRKQVNELLKGVKEDVEEMKKNVEEMKGNFGKMEQQVAKMQASMGHSKLSM